MPLRYLLILHLTTMATEKAKCATNCFDMHRLKKERQSKVLWLHLYNLGFAGEETDAPVRGRGLSVTPGIRFKYLR